jgi:F0F1-type ATP synthase membrane subunit b/b'
LFDALGYIFVGIVALAPWAMLVAAYFGRQWLVERIRRAVQHQFDERIEELRSDLRKSEEQFKADLQGKESEIATLRSTLLSGRASRQALVDKTSFRGS